MRIGATPVSPPLRRTSKEPTPPGAWPNRLMHEGDNQIVAAVQAGDVEAFRGLVERHQEGIHRFVRTFLRDYHEAQDVTAQTFEEAFRSLRSFRPEREKSFKGWLFGIAGNLCKDWLQDRRNRDTSLKLSFFGDLDSQPASIPDDKTARPPAETDRGESMRRALAFLPPLHREVLALWGLSGLSIPEVARALSISEPATRKRLSRARAELRRRLSLSTESETPPTDEVL